MSEKKKSAKKSKKRASITVRDAIDEKAVSALRVILEDDDAREKIATQLQDIADKISEKKAKKKSGGIGGAGDDVFHQAIYAPIDY